MCGRSAPDVHLTNEHVFAKSLRDVIADSDVHTVTLATGPTVAGLTRIVDSRPVNLMDVTTRTICGDCNSGWMSKLEVRANPVLRPLIDGASNLSADEVNTVRLWSAKTATVIQMAAARGHSDVPVDAADRRSIRDGVVPEAWVVTLTNLDHSWRHHAHHGNTPLPLRRIVDGRERIESYHFTVIEIGCMLVTVAGGPPDSDVAADVCQMTVTHLWKRVPAIEPVFDGQETTLGTWRLPSEEMLSQLLMTVTKFLAEED